MTERPIGICSICGGTVKVFSGAWGSVIPPTPTCEKCGAIAVNHVWQALPVLPMHKPGTTLYNSTAYSIINKGSKHD